MQKRLQSGIWIGAILILGVSASVSEASLTNRVFHPTCATAISNARSLSRASLHIATRALTRYGYVVRKYSGPDGLSAEWIESRAGGKTTYQVDIYLKNGADSEKIRSASGGANLEIPMCVPTGGESRKSARTLPGQAGGGDISAVL